MNDTETRNEFMTDEINLGQYLNVLIRWRRLIILCAVLGAAAALLFTISRQPSYATTASVAIVRSATIVNFDPKVRTVSNTDPTVAGLDQASLRKALTAIADSEDLAETVYAVLKPQLDPAIENANLLHLRVEVANEGDVIRITARSNSPQEAALIANGWAKEYVTRANEIYGENAASLDLLSGQIESAKLDRDAKQAAVVEYLRDNPADQLLQQLAEKQQIISSLRASKAKAIQSIVTETQQIQVRLMQDYLDALGNTRSTVFTQQVNARIQKLKDLYVLDLKLDRLLGNAQALRARLAQASEVQPGNDLAVNLLEASAFTTWTDLPVSLQVPISQLSSGRTPAALQQALDALIAELQQNRTQLQAQIEVASKALLADTDYVYLDESTTTGVSPLNDAIQRKRQALLDLQGLENIATYKSADSAVTAATQQLNTEVNALRAQIEIERAKKEQLDLARDLAQATFETIANKVEEAKVTQGAKGSVVRISTAAIAPTLPSSRNPLLTLGLGIVAGLVIGVGMAFALEYLGNSLTDAQQVKNVLGLSTLATIPDWGSGAAQEHLPAPVVEQLRGLRYQLLGSGSARTVMLTSSVTGEGVTTIAAQLAKVTAQGGKRVLLVDANLRQPRVHELFQLKQAPGLSELLSTEMSNTADWQALTHPTAIGNLTVLTAGSSPHDAAALLERQAFETLLQRAKDVFDLVILDTPAVNGIVDAVEAAHAVDGVLLVLDGAHTTRSQAVAAKDALTTSHASLLGVVLNRVGRMPGAAKTAAAAAANAVAPKNGFWARVHKRVYELVGPRLGS